MPPIVMYYLYHPGYATYPKQIAIAYKMCLTKVDRESCEFSVIYEYLFRGYFLLAGAALEWIQRKQLNPLVLRHSTNEPIDFKAKHFKNRILWSMTIAIS